MINETDRRIIARMCGDIGGNLHPYSEIAAELGISDQDLITRLQSYKEKGLLRRLGAVLRHRPSGYAANGMSTWNVPDDKISGFAEHAVSCREVSHCYERSRFEGWPYNMYAMIHGKTNDDVTAIAKQIAKATDINEYQVLFSVREFKKSSVMYFN